jgi:hypothetical protein
VGGAFTQIIQGASSSGVGSGFGVSTNFSLQSMLSTEIPDISTEQRPFRARDISNLKR